MKPGMFVKSLLLAAFFAGSLPVSATYVSSPCPARLLAYPVLPQDRDDACGISCLRSILMGWGRPLESEASLAAGAGTNPATGTPPGRLARVLDGRGFFSLEQWNTSLFQLQMFLALGESVILSVFEDRPHYVLLVGLSPNTITVMDRWATRSTGRNREMTYPEFLAQWYVTGSDGQPFFMGHAIRVRPSMF